MKSKIKRHSRSVLAVILTLSMLVSCMMVGLIATDAARVTDSGTVGAKVDGEAVGSAETYTVYFDNSVYNWSHIYVYSGASMSISGKVSSPGASTEMTTHNGSIYYLSMSVNNNKIAFSDADMGGWNDFSGNNAVWSDNITSTNCKITPNTSNKWSNNNTNYTFGTASAPSFAEKVSHLGYKQSGNQHEDFTFGTTRTATVNLTAGTHEIWIKLGEEYFKDLSGGTTMTRANCTNWEFKAGSQSNTIINADVAGNYTFTITNGSSGKINVSVTYPPQSSSSSYSLTGDIWNACVTQINGSTNTIARGSEDDPTWWGSYHSGAAVNTVESGTNVYSITITTASREALASMTPPFTTVDIGLYKNNVGQKAFKIGGTYYNYIGGDYKVTSAGVTNADIVDCSGGSLQLQPGRTYKITINEGVSPNTISVQCTSGDKYFLAGQYAADGTAQFFGETWNTSNNELIYNSSTNRYELEFTENIPAGTISFKTVKNGDSDGWDGGSYPTQNQSYKINANATKVKFSFDATNNTMTVTQENSGGGEGGTWPPTDTAVTNVTGSSTSTSKYLLVSNNDQFETNGGNTMTAVALLNKFESDNNTFYWADLTNYLSYDNLHIILSRGSSKNDAANLGDDSKVNDKDFILKNDNDQYISRDSYDYYDGSTKLF
ncbi:MAG: hypothetical protein Q3989_09105, partial [Eubacteriales bacterium]|nr:hypothetical protein [Eubacteriales bacterium]